MYAVQIFLIGVAAFLRLFNAAEEYFSGGRGQGNLCGCVEFDGQGVDERVRVKFKGLGIAGCRLGQGQPAHSFGDFETED